MFVFVVKTISYPILLIRSLEQLKVDIQKVEDQIREIE